MANFVLCIFYYQKKKKKRERERRNRNAFLPSSNRGRLNQGKPAANSAFSEQERSRESQRVGPSLWVALELGQMVKSHTHHTALQVSYCSWRAEPGSGQQGNALSWRCTWLHDIWGKLIHGFESSAPFRGDPVKSEAGLLISQRARPHHGAPCSEGPRCLT